MSAFSGPNVVDDGLVLCLDAANPNSYNPADFPPQNLSKHSQDFTNEFWPAQSGLTVIGNTMTSPNGTLTADTLTGNGSTVGYFTPSIEFTIGVTYTFSCYFKAGTMTSVLILLYGTNFNSGGANIIGAFDLSTGVVTSSNALSSSITPGGDGWYRCSITQTCTATGSSANQLIRLGSTTGYLYSWGFQVNTGPYVRPYTETTTTAVIPSLTWEDISGNNITGMLINYPEFTTTNSGVFAFNGINQIVDCGNPAVVNFGDGNFTVGAWFYRDVNATTNLRLLSKGGGADVASEAGFALSGSDSVLSFIVNPSAVVRPSVSIAITTGTPTYVTATVERGGLMKIYKNGNFSQSIATPTGSFTGAANLCIGCNTSSAGGRNVFWDGGVYNVNLYNRALSEQEIQQNFTALRSRYGI